MAAMSLTGLSTGAGAAGQTVGPGCEVPGAAPWIEPVSTVTSLAFVVVGVAILICHRGTGALRNVFAACVIGVGLGSVIQHGPAPQWADTAHDAPLAALLALVAADAVADATGRPMRHWWWLAPTALATALTAIAPLASDALQVAIAVVGVGATVVRASRRPLLRARLLWAMALLGVGAIIGTLSRAGGPLCVPESLLQGHGVWHVLAAAAMGVLAPTVGWRGGETGAPSQEGRRV